MQVAPDALPLAGAYIEDLLLQAFALRDIAHRNRDARADAILADQHRAVFKILCTALVDRLELVSRGFAGPQYLRELFQYARAGGLRQQCADLVADDFLDRHASNAFVDEADPQRR